MPERRPAFQCYASDDVLANGDVAERRPLPRVSFMVDAVGVLSDGAFNELSLSEQGELVRSICSRAAAGNLECLTEWSFIGRVYAGTSKRRSIPPSIRALVLAAGACAFCGAQERLTVDHVFPYSKGGTDDLPNLQCLCFPCNLRKSNRVVA